MDHLRQKRGRHIQRAIKCVQNEVRVLEKGTPGGMHEVQVLTTFARNGDVGELDSVAPRFDIPLSGDSGRVRYEGMWKKPAASRRYAMTVAARCLYGYTSAVRQ